MDLMDTIFYTFAGVAILFLIVSIIVVRRTFK